MPPRQLWELDNVDRNPVKAAFRDLLKGQLRALWDQRQERLRAKILAPWLEGHETRLRLRESKLLHRAVNNRVRQLEAENKRLRDEARDKVHAKMAEAVVAETSTAAAAAARTTVEEAKDVDGALEQVINELHDIEEQAVRSEAVADSSDSDDGASRKRVPPRSQPSSQPEQPEASSGTSSQCSQREEKKPESQTSGEIKNELPQGTTGDQSKSVSGTEEAQPSESASQQQVGNPSLGQAQNFPKDNTSRCGSSRGSQVSSRSSRRSVIFVETVADPVKNEGAAKQGSRASSRASSTRRSSRSSARHEDEVSNAPSRYSRRSSQRAGSDAGESCRSRASSQRSRRKDGRTSSRSGPDGRGSTCPRSPSRERISEHVRRASSRRSETAGSCVSSLFSRRSSSSVGSRQSADEGVAKPKTSDKRSQSGSVDGGGDKRSRSGSVDGGSEPKVIRIYRVTSHTSTESQVSRG
ncbi:hypothetical protein HIM_06303 [Hirsutella minnesotensis 3608]|uniref:Uncharacterized protein n=1 Tax=Hirsutella minnesotensis 3608 TaxID=1043627 RepID=A0A0F7ZZI8_9HYPO|nr:hypothetical protein HIM_06303 [Hirsutella minnesotensis 3608]